MLRFFSPWYYLLLVLFSCIASLRSQTVDKEKLFEQIHALNGDAKYEESIIILEQIITAPKSDYYDKYLGYYLKYLTYKRLYSYDRATVNLELALENGLKSHEHAQEIASQIKFEKVFIAFDLLEFHRVRELLTHIQDKDFAFIPDYTLAMYFGVQSSLSNQEGDYDKSIEYLDKGIEILENGSQVDLPLLYRRKINVYRLMDLHDKAIESFEKGMYYAKKYNMDIYI